MVFSRPRSRLFLCCLAMNSFVYSSLDPDLAKNISEMMENASPKEYSYWDYNANSGLRTRLHIDNPNPNSNELTYLSQQINNLDIGIIALYIIQHFEKNQKSNYKLRDLIQLKTLLNDSQGSMVGIHFNHLNENLDTVMRFISLKKRFTELTREGENDIKQAVSVALNRFASVVKISHPTSDTKTRLKQHVVLDSKAPNEDQSVEFKSQNEAEQIFIKVQSIIKDQMKVQFQTEFADGLLQLYESMNMSGDDFTKVVNHAKDLEYCTGLTNFRKRSTEWLIKTLTDSVHGKVDNYDDTNNTIGIVPFAQELIKQCFTVCALLVVDWSFLRLSVHPFVFCAAVAVLFASIGTGRKAVAQILTMAMVSYVLIGGARFLGIQAWQRVIKSGFAGQVGLTYPGFTELHTRNPLAGFFATPYQLRPVDKYENKRRKN